MGSGGTPLLGVQQTWTDILALPMTVVLGRVSHFPEPQSPHLSNGLKNLCPYDVLGVERRERVDADALFVVAVSILVLPAHRLGGRQHGEF